MPRSDVGPVRRAMQRRTSSLVAASLAVGLTVGLAAAPGLATAAPTVTRVAMEGVDETTPAGDPTEETTPPVEPTTSEPDPTTAPPTLPPDPEPTTPAPNPTTAAPDPTAPDETAPATTAPATTAPAPEPTAPGGPGGPAGPGGVTLAPPPGSGRQDAGQLGVRVTTRDVSLTPAYWNAASTVTTLRVTVSNTGTVPEQLRLRYTLPAGLTDAGTPGCLSSGDRHYRCGSWTAAPGAKFSTLIRIRVSGSAWRQMPLSGSVRVTATGPAGKGTAEDNEGFAVLFPPGPPVPGMTLAADEVAFDISGGPTELGVRLGNTGKVDAQGRVEIVLPAGVSVSNPPAGCVTAAPTRTRCDLGMLPAGRTATLLLPVAATPEAQREAPLAGAVIGRLDPRHGPAKQMQMTFRITAAAALTTPPVATPIPTGSQGVLAAAGRDSDDGLSSVQRIATALIAISALLVVLALALATTSLRRRMSGTAPEPAASPTTSD
ncbi:hypothetical protein V6U81_13005 [Micromonospora sp. CPCC 205711]|uniref:hypothetical protein n=1 Tax=Micromonospora sp. CPCC 205547 TaxID=3122400 RepID=UPI002FF01263